MRRTTTIDQDQGTHDATGLTITKYTEIITELDEREGWSQAQLDDLHAARVALASLPSVVRADATDWLADEQCEQIDEAATIRRAIRRAIEVALDATRGADRPRQLERPTGNHAEETKMDAIEKLTEQVQRVAGEATALDAAREAEDEAAIELLTRVIEIAQPIVHAIGTRPITRSVSSWINAVQTNEKIWRRDHRCICLSHDKPGPVRGAGDTSGPYEGIDLFLDEEGRLVELSYSGSWSMWQGSSSEWSTTVTEYLDAAAAYADGWHDVERYVERLSDIVAKANLTTATKKSRERAEKLSAIAALVRK